MFSFFMYLRETVFHRNGDLEVFTADISMIKLDIRARSTVNFHLPLSLSTPNISANRGHDPQNGLSKEGAAVVGH
jgi:hypothetical protein